MVVFQCTMPTLGPGALSSILEETKLTGTDDERSLFVPRNEVWRNLGEECAEEGIGVNMFLGMSQTIDVGSIGMFICRVFARPVLRRVRYRGIHDWR